MMVGPLIRHTTWQSICTYVRILLGALREDDVNIWEDGRIVDGLRSICETLHQTLPPPYRIMHSEAVSLTLTN